MRSDHKPHDLILIIYKLEVLCMISIHIALDANTIDSITNIVTIITSIIYLIKHKQPY